MRDTMPQPKTVPEGSAPKTYKAMFYESYHQAWGEARNFYRQVVYATATISVGVGWVLGFAMGGGFN